MGRKEAQNGQKQSHKNWILTLSYTPLRIPLRRGCLDLRSPQGRPSGSPDTCTPKLPDGLVSERSEATEYCKKKGFEHNLASYPIHSSIFRVDEKKIGRFQEASGRLPGAPRKPREAPGGLLGSPWGLLGAPGPFWRPPGSSRSSQSAQGGPRRPQRAPRRPQ